MKAKKVWAVYNGRINFKKWQPVTDESGYCKLPPNRKGD